jgi:hypothetical protein
MAHGLFGRGQTMPLYFFNHQRPDELLTDEEGVEFDSLKQVREEAVQAARDLIAEAAQMGRNAGEDEFIVTDDNGETVWRLKFADAIDSASPI